MIPTKLKRFLDRSKADYEVVSHPGKLMKKAVARVTIVKAGSQEVMVVLPSNCKLDIEKLRYVLESETLFVETEEEISNLFPDCERGAYPALGKPYRIPCFVDETILDGADVFISSGSRHESIRVNSDDYWRIAEAEIGDFRARC